MKGDKGDSGRKGDRCISGQREAWQEGRRWEAWAKRGQSVGRQLHRIQGHHERLGRTFYIGRALHPCITSKGYSSYWVPGKA
ncbi:hypothetical protein Pcinc_009744 [Petrolisthes cinctipes]|uniref:Uncharacterized protein n=1 Tax=Petrolisthes cinctipes TaxID=88211 RepID=A0AAE1G6D1_PETCI|nr:hypothetical protein Pcinc_009744 [Petrolisthes cinctipes]